MAQKKTTTTTTTQKKTTITPKTTIEKKTPPKEADGTKKPSTIESILKRGTVKVVPIDSIKQWSENPRKVTPESVEELAEIISPYGQVSDLIVWSKNNVIYKGNRTHKALKRLGYKEVSVKFVDFLSEEMANAYGCADNKGSDSGVWDYEAVQKLMNKIKKIDPDKARYTGFTEESVSKKIQSLMKKMEDKPDMSDKAKIIVVYTDPNSRKPLINLIREVAIKNKITIVDIA